MKTLLTAAAVAAAASFAVAGDVFVQGFEANTNGWFDQSNGWSGTVTRVASGTGGIASASGAYHAVFTQGGASPTGGFTRFDGYRSAWLGGYTASVDVYLSTDWANGEGFDYAVASNTTSNNHLRDFIFHVAKDLTGQLRVGASNNTNFDPRMDLAAINNVAINSSGWYTFQHVFRDAGDGSLAVDLNLLDALGNVLFTETRNNAADLLGTIAGGNRYGWFTNIDIADGINVDNARLTIVPLPPAAWAGLAMLGGIVGVRKLRRR
jgi:hypothetical protein